MTEDHREHNRHARPEALKPASPEADENHLSDEQRVKRRRIYVKLLTFSAVFFPLYLMYCYVVWVLWVFFGGWICLACGKRGVSVADQVSSPGALTFWPFWFPVLITLFFGAIVWWPILWAAVYYFSERRMAADMAVGNSPWAKPMIVGFHWECMELEDL